MIKNNFLAVVKLVLFLLITFSQEYIASGWSPPRDDDAEILESLFVALQVSSLLKPFLDR